MVVFIFRSSTNSTPPLAGLGLEEGGVDDLVEGSEADVLDGLPRDCGSDALPAAEPGQHGEEKLPHDSEERLKSVVAASCRRCRCKAMEASRRFSFFEKQRGSAAA